MGITDQLKKVWSDGYEKQLEDMKNNDLRTKPMKKSKAGEFFDKPTDPTVDALIDREVEEHRKEKVDYIINLLDRLDDSTCGATGLPLKLLYPSDKLKLIAFIREL